MTYYYPNHLPQVEDNVVAVIKSLSDDEIIVTLPEYGNLECFMYWKQISNKRYKKIKATVRVGKIYVFCVTNVDNEKGYVELSGVGMTDENRDITLAEFEKAKQLQNFIRGYTYTTQGENPTKEQFEEDYVKLSGILYDEDFLEKCEYDHPWDYIYGVALYSTKLDIFPVEELQDNLLATIKKRVYIEKKSVSKFINLNCYSEFGVEGIKKALLVGKDVDPRIKIILDGGSQYKISLETEDRDEDIEAIMEKCITTIYAENKKYGGTHTKTRIEKGQKDEFKL